MTDYDNDPRYEKVEDNVYFDTETDETIFVFHDDIAETMYKVFGTDQVSADQARDLLGPYLDKMSDPDWRRILGEQFDQTEYNDIFSDDSDLKEL